MLSSLAALSLPRLYWTEPRAIRWAPRLCRGLWPRSRGPAANWGGALVSAYRPINERSVWARPSRQFAGDSTLRWPAPHLGVTLLVRA